MRSLAGIFGKVPFAARVAARFVGDPLPVLGWKPFRRQQLVYGLPFRSLAIINDQKTVDMVMHDRSSQFPKSAIVYELLRPLIGEGVFGQPGGDHVRETRRIMARALALLDEKQIAGTAEAIANEYIERWLRVRPGPVSVGTELSRMTVDVVAQCTLGPRFDERQSQRFTDLFSVYHRKAKAVLLMLSRDSIAIRRAIVRELGLDEVGAEMRQLIRDRFMTGHAESPFLDMLKGSAVTGGDEERVLDEIAVMLLAGHETTASTLSWLAHELSLRPQMQDDAAAAMAGRPGGMFAGHAAAEVVTALTSEILRLYPPIGFFLRENSAPMELHEAQIPAGSLVLVAPRTLHRHADYWQYPDRFSPLRWFGQPPARSSYLPFGMGARTCPGSRFAGVEMSVITRLLLTRTRFAPAASRPPRPLWNLTSRPDPDVVLAVEPRKRSPANHLEETGT